MKQFEKRQIFKQIRQYLGHNKVRFIPTSERQHVNDNIRLKKIFNRIRQHHAQVKELENTKIKLENEIELLKNDFDSQGNSIQQLTGEVKISDIFTKANPQSQNISSFIKVKNHPQTKEDIQQSRQKLQLILKQKQIEQMHISEMFDVPSYQKSIQQYDEYQSRLNNLLKQNQQKQEDINRLQQHAKSFDNLILNNRSSMTIKAKNLSYQSSPLKISSSQDYNLVEDLNKLNNEIRMELQMQNQISSNNASNIRNNHFPIVLQIQSLKDLRSSRTSNLLKLNKEHQSFGVKQIVLLAIVTTLILIDIIT